MINRPPGILVAPAPFADEHLRSIGNVFDAVRTLPAFPDCSTMIAGGADVSRLRPMPHGGRRPIFPNCMALQGLEARPIHRSQLIECCSKCNASIVCTRPSLGQTPLGRRFNVSDCAGCCAFMVDGLLFAGFRLRQSDSQLKPPTPSISRLNSPVHQFRLYLALDFGLSVARCLRGETDSERTYLPVRNDLTTTTGDRPRTPGV